MDEKIEKAVKKIIEMYEEIEMGLLEMIASHFKFNEEFLNSDNWRIQKLQELGLFNEEVVEYIARYSGKTITEVKKALNQIAIDTIDIDRLRGLFEDGVIKINPDILLNNYTIQKMIDLSYNELTNRFVEVGRIIENSVREAYLNVIEETYLKTSMGTISYQQAIREAIDNLSNKGITCATYQVQTKNGAQLRNYDIEGTVRRDVLFNGRKLNGDITYEKIQRLGAEYIYISEHLDCRPQHFSWQGTVVRTEDFTKPLPTYPEYGSVIGIKGVNCRHYFIDYWGDPDDVKKEYSQEECDKKYAETQHQRYLERGVRKWKRREVMSKANGDIEEYRHSKQKVKEWQNRIISYTEENDLRRVFEREYVNDKNSLYYKDITKEK